MEAFARAVDTRNSQTAKEVDSQVQALTLPGVDFLLGILSRRFARYHHIKEKADEEHLALNYDVWLEIAAPGPGEPAHKTDRRISPEERLMEPENGSISCL